MLAISLVRLARLAARPSNHHHSRRFIYASTIRYDKDHGLSSTDKIKEAQKWADDLRRDWDAKVITYEELKPKSEQPAADTYLIDVREPDEVIQGMIPSAVNIPLSILPNALQLKPGEFRDKFAFEKPRIAEEVTFYCRSGKRSASACDIAKRNGYTNILNYQGSWLDWVEKEGKK